MAPFRTEQMAKQVRLPWKVNNIRVRSVTWLLSQIHPSLNTSSFKTPGWQRPQQNWCFECSEHEPNQKSCSQTTNELKLTIKLRKLEFDTYTYVISGLTAVMSSRPQCKIIPPFTSAASMILLSWNTWLQTIMQAWFCFYGDIKTSLLIHLITSKYSVLVGGEGQTLRVISYQKHHFPYNQTGSSCCHGDERLRFYSSDCLSSALCTQGWGLIWGYSCVPLCSNYHHQDGVVQFVRLLC